jgi:cytidylate kinase
MENYYLVTIDGFASSGKSTCAKELARRLGWTLLSTGAGHRVNVWNILKKKIDINNQEQLENYLNSINIDFKIEDNCFTPYIDGITPTKQDLHSRELVSLLPKVTKLPIVCNKFTSIYRNLSKGANVVAEGHGLGTGIFPMANVKFFCEASLSVRAQRRFEQVKANSKLITVQEIESQIAERDFSDQTRAVNPISCTEEMYIVDSNYSSPEQCVDQMVNIIKNYYNKGKK